MTDRELKIAKMIGLRIKQQDPEAEVILFGSHAIGQAKDESDWDVLILIDRPKSDRSIEDRYRNEMFQLELELGEPISTLVYSKVDWESKYIYTPLYQNIKREGVKLL
jgi:predicted nucleotidyltransferase